MSFKPSVPPLPEPERRERVGKFLALLGRDPELAHLRCILRTGPERQLALFAALERYVVKGSSAASPPSPEDPADLLLCDILDAIDRDPDLKDHGCAYGVDRHLANLQAFGLWRKRQPLSSPSALELFATTFSQLTAGAATSSLGCSMNNSPDPQEFSPNGELIDPASCLQEAGSQPDESPQTSESTLVVTTASLSGEADETPHSRGIIRHRGETCGEKCDESLSDAAGVASRTVRRGRPIVLDDLAKGRVLGLMSYGLSFRQAAAQLGVHHQTLLNAMKRDEEFAQQVSEARLDAISQPLLTVIQASRKNWRAAAWLAKFLNDRRASRYETTPEEHELSRVRS